MFLDAERFTEQRLTPEVSGGGDNQPLHGRRVHERFPEDHFLLFPVAYVGQRTTLGHCDRDQVRVGCSISVGAREFDGLLAI